MTQEATLMGTTVTVELWSVDEQQGQRLMEQALAEIARLDLMMNPWNPNSELARVNREAGEAVVTTTVEIIEVVSRALYYSKRTNGAFDISFASVGQYYDYRAGKSPQAAQIKQLQPDIDYTAIEVNAKCSTLRFLKEALQIDLGGIAKGYAVDRAIELLQTAGIQSAVVTAGGDSRMLGDLGDRPRTVGIRHPRKPEEYAVLIPLADTAISTSGDYERFFFEGGTRVHHILDPTTGKSADKVQSVSVITMNAIDSDALSTATFVLGVEKGLRLIDSLPGVDAIVIDSAGKLHYSQELLRQASP